MEVLIEYVKLFREGNTTFPAWLELLKQQRRTLQNQRQQIDDHRTAEIQNIQV